MTGFHEVRFPDDIAYGASGGPEYATAVSTTFGGYEARNANWSAPRGRWDVASGIKSREQVAALIAFFRARKGRAYGFRFKDWTDYQVQNQLLGTGDGVTRAFQLIKTYASGPGAEVRVISKPVVGTLKTYLDGVLTSAWTLNGTTGVVTFTAAPALAKLVTADFEFDVPARFDTDHMDISIETLWPGAMVVDPGHRDQAVRTIPAGLAAHVAGGVTTVCTCWKLTRLDGAAFYFTDHDADVVVDNAVYVAASGFSRSAIATNAQLAVDNADLDGLLISICSTPRTCAPGGSITPAWKSSWSTTRRRRRARSS
ncbi:MAG: TIGR02217 family protein [Rhodospirillales bacterium]